MTGPAVVAHELYRFYHAGDDEVLALRGVSVTVEPGEMVAVLGPSGSGKSTLLACIAGLDDPDAGSVRVAGEMMSRRPERARSVLRARSVGVLLQSGNLIEHLSVAANLRVAMAVGGGPGRRRWGRGAGDDALDRVGLTDRARAYPAQLSGGEAVRAGLAVALANAPAVVVADEPTAEVDAATEERLLDLLRAQTARGVALLVATHSAAVAAAADRVVTLADGRVVA